jgi:hypothetical protein
MPEEGGETVRSGATARAADSADKGRGRRALATDLDFMMVDEPITPVRWRVNGRDVAW